MTPSRRGVFAHATIAVSLAFLSGAGCSSPGTKQSRGAKEAIQSLQLKLDADDAPTRSVKKGLKALEDGKFAEAAKTFAEALRLDPRNGGVHFLSGLSYHLLAGEGDSSQGDLAEIGYRQALKFSPGHVPASIQLGHLLLQRKSYRQAQESYAYAVLLDSTNAEALRGLAIASYSAHDLRNARYALDAALALGNPSPELLSTAALIQAATGDAEASRASLASLPLAGAEAARTAKLATRVEAWQRHFEARRSDAIRSTAAAPDRAADKPGDPAGAPAAPAQESSASGPKMCLIDVVIISTEDLRGNSHGMNLLNGLQLQYNASLTRKRDQIIPLENDLTTSSTGTWQRTLSDAITIPAISYSLNIFNEQGLRHEVVARPTLVATDKKASDFFSGSSIHVELSGGTGGTGSVQDIPVGVKLAVTPEFIDGDRLQLQVEASRDFLESPTSTASFRSFVQTTKSRISANVTMGFDETLIIGGLSERENQVKNDGVPVLSQIPLIQYFFSKKVKSEFTKSIMVLLTPRRPRYADSDSDSGAKVAMAMSASPSAVERATASAPPSVQKLAAKDKRFFKPIPNVDRIIQELDSNDLFILIRDGDAVGQEWVDPRSLKGVLRSALDLLYF